MMLCLIVSEHQEHACIRHSLNPHGKQRCWSAQAFSSSQPLAAPVQLPAAWPHTRNTHHKVTSEGPKTTGRTSRGCGLCLAMASVPHGLPLPWFLVLTAQLVPHTKALLQQTDKAVEACVPHCTLECCDWHCTNHNGPPRKGSVALHSKSRPQHSWDFSQYSCRSWCAVSEDAGT